jgi:hypothetical protein
MNKCPDCQGDLEKGVLLDQSYGQITAQRYAKAEIADSKDPKMMGVFESNFSDIRRIVALRCLKCNRVFLYAQNTITVSNLNARGKKIFLLIFVIMALCALFVYIGLG